MQNRKTNRWFEVVLSFSKSLIHNNRVDSDEVRFCRDKFQFLFLDILYYLSCFWYLQKIFLLIWENSKHIFWMIEEVFFFSYSWEKIWTWFRLKSLTLEINMMFWLLLFVSFCFIRNLPLTLGIFMCFVGIWGNLVERIPKWFKL